MNKSEVLKKKTLDWLDNEKGKHICQLNLDVIKKNVARV